MKNLDIRQHALNLLKLSKKFFLKDGDLDPTVFIITADAQLLRPIEVQDEASKIESCTKIIDEARRQNALAIVTVFLAGQRILIVRTLPTLPRTPTLGEMFKKEARIEASW